jgi:CHAT domain
MRIWIDISAVGEEAYRVDVKLGSDGGETLATNTMRRLDHVPWVAPVTGEQEGGSALGKARETIERVAEGETHKGQVRLLGRYLFDSLLSQAAWAEILEKAQADRAGMIELALSWPADLRDLHRLPWEAMHDGDSFLGANSQLAIAITRVVQTGRDSETLPVIPAPARVLFAIGTESGDPKVRVGMEVVGLLREAERGPGGVDPLILESASIESLEEACKRFQPNIVHFVGHGRTSRQGNGELALRDAETDERTMVGAVDLMSALSAADELPTVVVLTGCKSAATGGHVDPLAAELVRKGVPIVVGMAGRIADPVCRLFARRFGASLSSGVALVKAVTDGRRAGLQKQVGEADDDPAWVLPSVYIAPEVTTNYAPVDAAGHSPVRTRVKRYDIKLDPVFCGRVSLTEQFDRLLKMEDDCWTLIAYTESNQESLGRTRLLHEFAVRALRRGHLVVMIDDPGPDISLLPRRPSQLASEMLEATIEARHHFDLDTPQESLLAKELEEASGFQLDLDGATSAGHRRGRYGAFIDKCRENDSEINDADIRGMLPEILPNDLVQLAADAREGHPETFGEQSRVVVILGGVGNWGGMTKFLFEKLLGAHGLGSPEEPVPVFATCSMDDSWTELKDARENANPASTHWENFGRFRGGEELLAYLNVLLYPLKARAGHDILPAYVPNRTPPAHAHDWENELKEAVRGVPGNFRNPMLNNIVRMLARTESLLEADDDDVMKSYLARQK